MAIIRDFLDAEHDPQEILGALGVLRRFKEAHTMEEDFCVPFVAWTKLEQLEEFLDHMANGAPLRADTLEYVHSEREGQSGL